MAGFPDAARWAAAHVVVSDVETPVLDDGDCHHLASVLRLRDGEQVSVTDGRGGWRVCRFVVGGPSGAPGSGWTGATLVPDGEAQYFERPVPELCVAFAPVKGDRPEWAVQKLTELGIDRIVLIRTERTVLKWEGARADSHLQRLRSVACQALMQSRGLWMPAVEGVHEFGTEAAVPGAVLAEPGGVPVSLESPVVLVGPEGGWTDAERVAARGRSVSLGSRVLRTETAAVAAGVLLSALRDGLVAPR